MATALPPSGLLPSLRRLLASALKLAETRLELVVTELEEERLHLLALVGYGVAAFFLLGLGVLFLVFFITVMLWDSNRLVALGGFTAFFLIAGVLTGYLAVRHAHTKKRLFSSSLAELARDRAALDGEPPPSEKAQPYQERT